MRKPLISQRSRQAFRFYQDRTYFSRLVQIALPIILQQFIMSSLNMVGVLMIGQIDETAVAAAGLANQVFFLLSLFLFGVTSGAAIFTAQLWGRADVPNIRRVLGLSVVTALLGSSVFFAAAELIPQVVIGVYSKDPAVVVLGAEYLRIYGLGFPFVAITYSYAAVLRSTGDVKKPLVVSIGALSLNMVFAYGLIFGVAGLPEMGATGAAAAGAAARVIECFALLAITYRSPSPAAARLTELFRFDLPFASRVLQRVAPVALNELLWSLGITTYNIIFARIGTEAIAAVNITSTIDGLALVIFIGVANACAILVGNQIGAGNEREAYDYAARTLSLSVLAAILMGGLILVSAGPVLSLYKVSAEVVENAHNVLVIIALFLWLRVSNMLLYIGIFRAGGDTRFAFLFDVGTIWVVGVPVALLGAFVLHLPLHWVYLMIMLDEFTKWIIGMGRFVSKKWIHNLAQGI